MIVGCVTLASLPARSQWWSRAPADFEDCADHAEKITAKDARTTALSECNAKFAGRRKPGGGYTYFDFMQNRTFDIAGPNPTPDEQKKIDEEYTGYLEGQRRSSIVAAFVAKKEQMQQQASLHGETEKPVMNPSGPRVAHASAGRPKPPRAPAHESRQIRTVGCPSHAFSCEWPRLSEGINDLKNALFGSSSNKPRPKQGLSG
jgi:hypothetical protein